MPEQLEPIINYSEIIAYLGSEIDFVWKELISSEDEGIVSLIKSIKSIEISDEQHFRKQETDRKLRKGTVYLIVRFSSGPINYASSVTPVSIYALGVANQVKPVQLLLGTFASYWTTKNLGQDLSNVPESNNMLQVWNTPEVVSNFNVVDEDFRNLYRVTGNIVIGPNAVRLGVLTYIYDETKEANNPGTGSEKINIMAFHDSYHASLDSQPFGNTNGFVQSEANFSTYTFSISTYLLDSQLAKDILAVRGFRYRPNGTYSANTSTFHANKSMKLKLEFTNDYTNVPGTSEATSSSDPVKGDNFYAYYKVVDSQISQEIAGIPALTITFTR